MATILIVDDVAANRQFLVTLLLYQGHRLIEAADGLEGLSAVKAEHPDLVITDVLMPVMDGYEFVRQLRLDPETVQIPVVFYTAHYGEREARALALTGGVADVLTKPAAAADVLQVVQRLLAGQPASATAPPSPGLTPEYDREHLRLLTDKLSEQVGDLGAANGRLRALINVGLELSSERDPVRRLEGVCNSARDLFRATYVTLGLVDRNDRCVRRIVTCGTDASRWIKPGDAVSGILETVVVKRRTLRGVNPGGFPASLLLPVHHPEVKAFLAAPIASPGHVYGWICLVANEGRAFTEDSEQLVAALAGQIGRICELDHEILERQQMEIALRHERDRAQGYLDTAEVILLAVDLAGRITLINRKGCALLGWSEDELVGRDWFQTCLPDRLATGLKTSFLNSTAGDRAVTESPVLTKSGHERTIEWRHTAIRDETGQIVGTFSSGADVTERNDAVDTLLKTGERTQFALEAAGIGIWDMDLSTGRVQWSDVLEAQHGLQGGTFEGTLEAFRERIHPEDRAPTFETMTRAMKSGADFSVLNRSLWSDGTVRWLRGAGRFMLNERGEAVRGLGISQDITDSRILEGRYQQAQKMEAIGQLAGGVAHDFNNLLTVILAYSDLLMADLGPDDPRHGDVAEIQKAGASAASLTRQLLAFSRKEIVEPTSVNLNVVISGMQAMLRRLVREDVIIEVQIGANQAVVRADRGQLEQVLVLNLAVNARDAMPDGGTLTIETGIVELHETEETAYIAVKPGTYVTLTVKDTGTGMTAAVQERLFEPFFTTKELGRGTGLGLATVYGIVQRTGGSIRVSSEVGVGSTFTMYLPRTEATDVAVSAPAEVAPRRGSTQTVLVVEDAEGLRGLARKLLQRGGYTVLVAADAKEACQLFEQTPSIDVLLTDVVMPGVSGTELSKRLLEQRPALKVIYMSGYAPESVAEHGVFSPGVAFLRKPFSAEMLERTLDEVLHQ